MGVMSGVNIETVRKIERRVRLCDYLSVAQLYLQNNFLLERPLAADDIKPRLLGHWGTCHGINVAYANFRAFFRNNRNFSMIVGTGHGFPALQANLFLDGELLKIDGRATLNEDGLAYICRNFSWPDGFPSHASPLTPGVVAEGGELGYALATGYGVALGHPEKVIAVLIGDGELETATAIDSLNLRNMLGGKRNGHVLPILHLNGYKISAPSIYGRKSERELNEMLRGFGFTPVWLDGEKPEKIQEKLAQKTPGAFYILKTEKGFGGPNRHHLAHQIPLKNPKTDAQELEALEVWLKSYNAAELFDRQKGEI